MSLAHFTTGAFLIVFLMGAAWAAPTTPSSTSEPKNEHDSPTNNGLLSIKATTNSNRNESAATTLGVELGLEFQEEAKCHSDWQKFLADFDVHYASDSETQKRRNIFCANRRRIQEHNVQFEEGKVSFKKKINQWADLTFEEWKKRQETSFSPNMEQGGNKTESTEVDQKRIKCQAAWAKFLTDYERKYESDAETEKRREIFCENWQRIQEHNALYESGKVSSSNRIDQWSDLTFEEVKNKTQNTFPPNMEEPGTYVAETTLKPVLVNTNLTAELPQIVELQGPAITEVSEHKAEASESDQKCQAAWEKFLTDYSPKYINEDETVKRRSIFCENWRKIEEHNVLYELGKVFNKKSIDEWTDLSIEESKIVNPEPEVKTESTAVEVGAQEYWGLVNNEPPGRYVDETTIKPKLVDSKPTEESPQNRKPKDLAETEVPGNETNVSEVDPKCQAVWEKFLTDYKPQYINEDETVKRRSIFCENWRKIEEHNVLYELGKVSNKKSIDEFTDLSIEESKIVNPEPEVKTESTAEEVGAQEYWGLVNNEPPGRYVDETTIKPKLVDSISTEENLQGRNLKDPAETEVPGNETNVSEVDQKCQAVWEKFLTDYKPQYINEDETVKRRSIFCENWRKIEENNVLYELGKVSNKRSIDEFTDLSIQESKIVNPEPEVKTESTAVEVGAQEYWGLVNNEPPGRYVDETTIKPKLGDSNPTEESPHNRKLKDLGNTEVPGNETSVSEVDRKCQAAWGKFLTDYSPKYINEDETVKRRSIFCENWRKIEEHNVLYELGKVSNKKSIDELTDLSIEESKIINPEPEVKTESTAVEVGAQEYWGLVNNEPPGRYVDETTIKPKLVDSKPTEESPQNIKLKESAETEVTGNETNLSEVDQKCQAAWGKFLTDYSPKYINEDETVKRRSIFCENWRKIEEHNVLYELGKVSNKKSIDEFTDLSIQESKIVNPEPEVKTESTAEEVGAQEYWGLVNNEPPGRYVDETTIKPKLVDSKPTEESPQNRKPKDLAETEVPGNETSVSEVDRKCQAAWGKFLTDYSPKYINEDETVKRRSIFCENWRKIEEHNVLYELGKVSNKKSIDEFTDLSIEESKIVNPEPEVKTESTAVEVGAQEYWGLVNNEPPGRYVDETTIKPKLVDSKPTEENLQGRNLKDPAETEVPGNETNVSEVDQKCQAVWEKFLTDYKPQYINEDETVKRRSIFCENWRKIEEHNVLYELGKVSNKKSIDEFTDLSIQESKIVNPEPEVKTESTAVEVGAQEYWGLVNNEPPGRYVDETTIKPKLVGSKPTEESPQNRKPKDLAETEVPGNETNVSEVDQKCQAAWEKFLTDYSPKYINEDETMKRRSIFCENWRKIEEHNVLYELGKVSNKRSIDEWTDLSIQESKIVNPEPEVKTESTAVEVGAQEYWGLVNNEPPGRYVDETTIKSKLRSEQLPVEAPVHPEEVEKLEEKAPDEEIPVKEDLTDQVPRS